MQVVCLPPYSIMTQSQLMALLGVAAVHYRKWVSSRAALKPVEVWRDAGKDWRGSHKKSCPVEHRIHRGRAERSRTINIKEMIWNFTNFGMGISIGECVPIPEFPFIYIVFLNIYFISVYIFFVYTCIPLKNSVLCDVTSCGSCKHRRFGETYPDDGGANFLWDVGSYKSHTAWYHIRRHS
jgi:hypothetical protein